MITINLWFMVVWSGCNQGTPPVGGDVMKQQPTGGRGVRKEHPLLWGGVRERHHTGPGGVSKVNPLQKMVWEPCRHHTRGWKELGAKEMVLWNNISLDKRGDQGAIPAEGGERKRYYRSAPPVKGLPESYSLFFFVCSTKSYTSKMWLPMNAHNMKIKFWNLK